MFVILLSLILSAGVWDPNLFFFGYWTYIKNATVPSVEGGIFYMWPLGPGGGYEVWFRQAHLFIEARDLKLGVGVYGLEKSGCSVQWGFRITVPVRVGAGVVVDESAFVVADKPPASALMPGSVVYKLVREPRGVAKLYLFTLSVYQCLYSNKTVIEVVGVNYTHTLFYKHPGVAYAPFREMYLCGGICFRGEIGVLYTPQHLGVVSNGSRVVFYVDGDEVYSYDVGDIAWLYVGSATYVTLEGGLDSNIEAVLIDGMYRVLFFYGNESLQLVPFVMTKGKVWVRSKSEGPYLVGYPVDAKIVSWDGNIPVFYIARGLNNSFIRNEIGRWVKFCMETNCTQLPWGLVIQPRDDFQYEGYYWITPLGLVLVGNVNMTRKWHVIRISLPNGTLVFKAHRGDEFSFTVPKEIVLNNGTKFVGLPRVVKFVVDRDAEIVVEYQDKMYFCEVVLHNGSVYMWIRPGPYVPPNILLDNETLLVAQPFVVNNPGRYLINYTRFYYVHISTPFNETIGWYREGTKFDFPLIVQVDNGTRYIDPSPSFIVADRPIKSVVTYRRQYYITISGLAKWQGWANEGAVIKLNSTIADGVVYIPKKETLVVTAPGKYEVMYTAEFKTEAKDVFGVPNPAAWITLCDAEFSADYLGRIEAKKDTNTECQLYYYQWPISPYTIAITILIVVILLSLKNIIITKKK